MQIKRKLFQNMEIRNKSFTLFVNKMFFIILAANLFQYYMKGYFKDYPCFAQLCILAIISICSICFSLFIYQVYLKFFPYSLRSTLILQNSLPLFLTAINTQYLITDKPLLKAFCLNRPGFKLPLTGIIILIASGPFIDLLNSWNQSIHLPESMKALELWMTKSEEQVAKLTKELLSTNTWKGLLFNIFQIAILAGVCEELLFRGLIQRIMIRWTKSTHGGIWIAAIIFSAIHLQFFGFLPRMVLGAILGYLFAWSGSLWIPIIAHTVNNAFVVIASQTYSMSEKHFIEPLNKIENSLWYGIMSFILIIAGLYMLRTMRLRKSPDIV